MKRLVLYTSLSFVAGLLVAGSALFFYMRWRLVESDSVHAVFTASSYLSALAPLQAGDTNSAVRRLHVFLDGEIIALATMPQTEMVTGALGRVKYYRSLYPYNSADKEIDATTQKILSAVEAYVWLADWQERGQD
jgi:hypothetical protein